MLIHPEQKNRRDYLGFFKVKCLIFGYIPNDNLIIKVIEPEPICEDYTDCEDTVDLY